MLVLVFGLVLVSGCSGSTPPPEVSTDATAAAGPSASGPADVAEPAPTALDAAAQAALLDIKDRQKCNRVTGCAPLTTLLSRGPAVLDAVAATLAAAPHADGYWAVALTDALGELGDARAATPLRKLATDPRWEVKMAALRALGRLADRLDADTRKAIVAELEQTLARPDAQAEPSWLGSLHFALARLDKASDAVHRQALIALVPADEASMKAMAAPFLDVLVVLAGELRATQALPGIRWAATSENRFVSVHALEVLANLQDTGGIPYVLTRVEDANPTIRRTAIDALQRITGAGFETAEQWRTWAKAHALADIPKAP